jgi:polysaccharide biosynthesis/export protein
MKNRILLAFLVATASLPPFVAGQTAAGQTPAAQSAEAGMLSPGDSVRITVWRSPELSGDFVVGPDGAITHPLYRTVKVAGLPMATVESNIGRFLAGLQTNPQFVVEPLVSVAVSGEITRPQIVALRPGTSVAQAVIRAGGVTQNGRWDKVRLIRTDASGRRQEYYADLRDPSDRYGAGSVRSGDLIVIDRKKSILKDVILPVLGVIGSVASVGLLIERTTR